MSNWKKPNRYTIDEKVKRFDEKLIHYFFTVAVSVITAMLTALAYVRLR